MPPPKDTSDPVCPTGLQLLRLFHQLGTLMDVLNHQLIHKNAKKKGKLPGENCRRDTKGKLLCTSSSPACQGSSQGSPEATELPSPIHQSWLGVLTPLNPAWMCRTQHSRKNTGTGRTGSHFWDRIHADFMSPSLRRPKNGTGFVFPIAPVTEGCFSQTAASWLCMCLSFQDFRSIFIYLYVFFIAT